MKQVDFPIGTFVVYVPNRFMELKKAFGVGIVVGTRPDNRVIVFFPNAPNTTWMITPELVKKLVCLKERP